MVKISAVMPAYNEQDNIKSAVGKIDSFLKDNFKDYEIIVVNDGSVDETGRILERLSYKNKKLRVLHNIKNLGYGATLWRGLKAAKGELIFFTDSDLQFDIRQLARFLREIKNCDAVVGYRVKRSEGFMRAFNAWGWSMACRILLGIKYRDIDCAFKLIKGEYIKKIKIISTGAAFSAELLYRLEQSGAKIVELPVKHFLRQKGKATGTNISVIIKAFGELWILFCRRIFV